MKIKLFTLTVLVCTQFLNFSNAQQQGDISLYTFGSIINHDNNACASNVVINNTIQVENSFLNDSLKVIDHNGNTIQTFVNTTGVNLWQVTSFTENTVVEDVMVFNGMITVPILYQINKLISGPDTLYNNSFQVTLDGPANPCTYSTITGRIYIDNDTDCTYSTGDSGVNNMLPSVTPTYSNGTYYSYSGSNPDGNYTIQLQESWLTNFTVNLPSLYQFAFAPSSCFTNTYSFGSLPQLNVDFPLSCEDIDTYVGAYFAPARPAISFPFYPRVNNIGCTPVSGQLKLKLDPNVSYNAATSQTPADQINGDTLIWNYNNLNNLSNNILYSNQFLGMISLTPSLAVNIGDTLQFELSTQVHAADVNPSNNIQIIKVPIVNSYDPNIKKVSPAGIGSEGFIPATTEKLTYTIHFQNTGTAEAINIKVIDTLEANLLPQTLRIIGNSHAMSPSWLNGNTIQFNFPNINLPDSMTNEPLSHGFVKFEIEMAQGLTPGTEIKNQVGIYFDTNEPIITNFATNTIEFPTSVGMDKLEELQALVYPNPTKDKLYFQLSKQANATVELMNLQGKIVANHTFNGQTEIHLDLSDLSSGIYLYSITDHQTLQSTCGKIVVNR